MNKNSIKEDIERLKLCSTNQCNICGRYEKEECMLERNRCEQHILLDYKRILKENEKLKALDSSNSKMIANMSKRHFQDREKIRNYIPIQKIKDKIEEIKAKMGKDCIALHEFQREAKIDVLQQLLGKE